MSYTATFTPEAWQRDQAVEVDPQGPVTWDCTAWALRHAAYVLTLNDEGTDVSDVFKNDPAAPQWIRDWHGPFTIHIEDRALTPSERDALPGRKAQSERMAEISRKTDPHGGESHPAVATVENYLPRNYRVTDVSPVAMWIRGHDVAGWTLDGYVIPRLASGMITAREIPVQDELATLPWPRPAAKADPLLPFETVQEHRMDDMTEAVYRVLIEQARSLFDLRWEAGAGRSIAEMDADSEHVRGIVELITRACGLSHDVHDAAVRHDLTFGLHAGARPLQYGEG